MRTGIADRTTLEGTLVFPFITHGSTLTPAAPTGTPSFEIRSVSGLGSGTSLITGSATAMGGGGTGEYYISQALTAAAGFAAGTYFMIISYVISGTTYTDHVIIPVD